MTDSRKPESADLRTFYEDLLSNKGFNRQAAKIARRYGLSRADAEDILLECIYKFNTRYDPIRGTPYDFLFSIVGNAVKDFYRSAKVRRTVPLDRDDTSRPSDGIPDPVALRPEDALHKKQVFNLFYSGFGVLTPDERAVFLLRHGLHAKNADIARILGKTEEAVRKLASTAKAKFAEAFPRTGAADIIPQDLDLSFTREELRDIFGDDRSVDALLHWLGGASFEETCDRFGLTPDGLRAILDLFVSVGHRTRRRAEAPQAEPSSLFADILLLALDEAFASAPHG